jgi:PAS domain S-box-containing protein
MNVRRTSVAAVLAVALVAVATLLMGVLGAVHYASYRERRWTRLREQAALHADQLAVALVLPVWSIDRDQIDRVLESLSADRDAYAVTVEAAGVVHARVRDRLWRFPPTDQRVDPGPEEGLIGEERAIAFSGETIGSLRLYTTPRFLEADLAGVRASTLSSIASVDLLLVLSVYFVVWLTVLKPLRAIERHAVAVSSGASEAALPAARFTGELESLRASLAAMVQLLDRRYAEVTDEVVRRRESEERLRGSEKRYRDIFDFAPIGILQAARGAVATANHAFARILGYDRAEEVLGLSMRDDVFVDPRERDELVARYEAVGLMPQVEARFRRRDGTTVWIEGTSHVVKDGAGEISYVESFIQDITARRAAAEALRSSEERYRRLFEGNPVPMLLWDLETLGFLAVNEAAVLQYGYPRDELLSLSLPDLAVPGDPELPAYLATRFDPRADLVRIGNRRQRRRDGSVVDIDLTVLHMVFDGRPAQLMLARDVSAEKRAAEEHERLRESLRRSETMSAMGALVAGVAHEVRNPLFGITASLDALEDEIGSRPEYARYAPLLRAQVARLTQLMSDLLDYGKPPIPKIAPATPAELTRRALRACRRLAREQGVALADDVAAGLPEIPLDAGRIEQVFENLLTNAVQHSPKGGVVRLGARLAPGPPPAIEFRVEDDGPGITAADLPRLFEPFFSRRKGGTGLGLPIIQRIVEAHGGQVVAANREPRGAVFTVSLPLERNGMA